MGVELHRHPKATKARTAHSPLTNTNPSPSNTCRLTGVPACVGPLARWACTVQVGARRLGPGAALTPFSFLVCVCRCVCGCVLG